MLQVDEQQLIGEKLLELWLYPHLTNVAGQSFVPAATCSL